MALNSVWFSGNERLQRCLVSDPAHVKRGDKGMEVLLIQEALMMIDGGTIAPGELEELSYGPSTAAATLAYKRKRNIINRAYQTTADDIVGKMTIQSLDDEMRAKEQRLFTLSGGSVPFLRGLFFAPTVKSTVKAVVVSEMNAPWLAWAQNFKKTFDPIGAELVTINNGAPISIVANRLKLAASLAGPNGFIILSVGHGGGGQTGLTDEEGFFDLGPQHSFRLGGRNALMPGDVPPSNQVGPVSRVDVSAFYDFRVPNASLKGGFAPSHKDDDEKSKTAAAKKRLENFSLYEDVSRSFRNLSGVILLTCKVAGASGFLRRVRQQWGTPIIGYRRRVSGQTQQNGRTRIFLDGDAPGTGTNTALGEFLFPLTGDLVVIQ